MEIEENIQWHPAFCSAMELELREYKKYLQYEREHSLTKMPLGIDFLVIKKDPHIAIQNDIGDFFLGHNIFEYKSPGDEMNSGTFYKALAYACLYEAETRSAGNTLDTDITVSLAREQEPTQLLKQLEQKYHVTKKATGIYRVSGALFPLQILVTGKLDKVSHIWITSLTKTLDRERTERLLGSYYGLAEEEDRDNADSVLNVTAEANIEIFKALIQEGNRMSEALKKLLAPEIIELRTQLADKDTQLADKDTLLADKDTQLADKDTLLAEQGVQIANMDAEIIKLKAMLAQSGIEV